VIDEYEHGEVVQVDDDIDFRYGKTAHTATVVMEQIQGSPQKRRKTTQFLPTSGAG
jgi:hypothetical protein